MELDFSIMGYPLFYGIRVLEYEKTTRGFG